MEIFNWVEGLVLSTLSLNMPNIITLVTMCLAGLVGGNIVGAISKKLSLSFIGNTLFGVVGGIVGAFFFLQNIYNLTPTRTSLLTFDNTINLDMLTGLITGGILGGLAAVLVLGLIKATLFGSRAAA